MNYHHPLRAATWTPLIPVLDPFRLQRTQILIRAKFLRGLGFEQIVLASTDDERYNRVMPALVTALKQQTGLRIVEHFRPTRRTGFRAQQETSWVIMSRVISSKDPHFRTCRRINREPADRVGRGISSVALPVGIDLTSMLYVAAKETAEDEISSVLHDPWTIQFTDVFYLFCRESRLKVETVSSVRALIGDRPFLVASGNVRSGLDVKNLMYAGASGVAVGSVFEATDWRKRIAEIMQR
ncbi:hypothetical protein WNZ15_25940 [Roseibium sp. AS2]|uniref:hypothetical protein n=1 Tax=Roseibium sp. AS2 TaxID=3135781 RepID=UPI0031790DB8